MSTGNDVQTYYKSFPANCDIGVDGNEKFWQYMCIEVGSVDNESKIKENK